jgi:catechol 2,3-dioxygenase-like lactoylglutathione lyase family enzyme
MLTSFYPVLLTSDVASSVQFYRERLQFKTVFAADWYVSLRREPHFELAVLDGEHATIPESIRGATRSILLNLEVEDVDAEYERLVVRGGLTPLLELRSEDFGQRHFILAAPDGVAIDIITPIEPTPEYAAQFVEGD